MGISHSVSLMGAYSTAKNVKHLGLIGLNALLVNISWGDLASKYMYKNGDRPDL